MSIAFYNGECDNCGMKRPDTFLQVWQRASSGDGLRPQFWCFDCLHGISFLPNIKDSVTFIFLKEGGKYVPNGTGFLVRVEVENDRFYSHHQSEQERGHVMYLVTAKHVLQENLKGEYHHIVSIRVNTHDGKSKYFDIDLDKAEIFVHDDPDVDIAVISLSLNPNIFDFRLIPEYVIPDQNTLKKLEIHEGDEVFFSGLFESHYGQQRNQPIMRFGKVALITDEKIEWKETIPPKLLELYLLECQSYSGNSGSPVFFNLLRQQGRKLNEQSRVTIYLAGILKGSFHIKEPDIIMNAYLKQNMGIAAVTPSYRLREILYSKKVKQNRQTATEHF